MFFAEIAMSELFIGVNLLISSGVIGGIFALHKALISIVELREKIKELHEHDKQNTASHEEMREELLINRMKLDSIESRLLDIENRLKN